MQHAILASFFVIGIFRCINELWQWSTFSSFCCQIISGLWWSDSFRFNSFRFRHCTGSKVCWQRIATAGSQTKGVTQHHKLRKVQAVVEEDGVGTTQVGTAWGGVSAADRTGRPIAASPQFKSRVPIEGSWCNCDCAWQDHLILVMLLPTVFCMTAGWSWHGCAAELAECWF